MTRNTGERGKDRETIEAVSYTHLDVYKRQIQSSNIHKLVMFISIN